MPPTTVDAPALYQKVGHLLQQGLRTSTYKLATLSALVDHCVAQQAPMTSTLVVPIDDLAKRVFAIYWPQTEPFVGIRLRQSTQSTSRIFDSIDGVRSASTNPSASLTDAVESAPEVYRRAIDNVALVIAQQPLPRLQRTPGAARSLNLLFDDSFLHDGVTRHDLAKHNNSITLHRGIAAGLSVIHSRLQVLIRSVWVDDVVRLNKLAPAQRQDIADHLFGAHSVELLQHPSGASTNRDSTTVNPSQPVQAPASRHTLVPRNAPLETTGGDADWGVVVGPGLGEIAAICEVRPDGCWVAPSNSPVRCRPPMDTRSSIELPKMPLHRWAWLVDNYRSHQAVAPHIIQIHRRCGETTCCNPEHLYPAAPGGAKLTHQQVDELLNRTAGRSPTSPHMQAVSSERTVFSPTTTVLTEDLAVLASLCVVNESGCWLAPTTSALPCRAPGDDRPLNELPKLSAPRWAWKVAHDQLAGPLPGSQFQVWKRCSNRRCCNPEHLYITGQDGRECTVEEAQGQLEGNTSTDRFSALPPNAVLTETLRETVGRHRAPSTEDVAESPQREDWSGSDEIRVVADRLNALIDERDDLKDDTDAKIASSLAQDGLAMSASLVARLRTGSGSLPSTGTLEALAYFFNVDSDYFTGGRHSNAATGRHSGPPTGVDRPEDREHESTTQSVEKFDLARLSQLIGALSELIVGCLTEDRPDVERARRLAGWIIELSPAIESVSDATFVDMNLVQTIVDETGFRLLDRREQRSSLPPKQALSGEISESPATVHSAAHHNSSPQRASGDWTRETFIDAVRVPSDRAFLLRTFELLDENFTLPLLGSHTPFYFGKRPNGAVFVYPFGLRHPPFHFGINSDGRLTIRGCWRGFPKVSGHYGFGELARLLGQDELGPSQNVTVDGLDAGEVWSVGVRVARAINR